VTLFACVPNALSSAADSLPPRRFIPVRQFASKVDNPDEFLIPPRPLVPACIFVLCERRKHVTVNRASATNKLQPCFSLMAQIEY
jgi:hypothetical protein